MINLEMMNLYLPSYLEELPRIWPAERFKWEAVACFQANWDLEAADFRAMFEAATAGTGTLLSGSHACPRAMILAFAEADAEGTRQMFRDLFAEETDLSERVQSFQAAAEQLRLRYGAGMWKNHFQNTGAISTYLWLRYPESYPIYRYEVVRDTAEELCRELKPKNDGSAESLLKAYDLYAQIGEVLEDDDEFCEVLSEAAKETGFADPAYQTAIFDFCHYISAYFIPARKAEVWFPRDYDPGITAEQWQALLQEPCVFTRSSLQIMKRMLDLDSPASWRQLSDRYGETSRFYEDGSEALARAVAERTDCPLMRAQNDRVQWWPILYLSRYVADGKEQICVRKLRRELRQALDAADLSAVSLYAGPAAPEQPRRKNRTYTEADFLSRVYMPKERFEILEALVRNKKNVILQGAPGVGKTFIARKLAFAMMGEAAEKRVAMVQFHQNYSYEDFIMGYRPDGAGFRLTEGVFYRFCKKAADDPDHMYFFIIDEINRGNLSKILGELMMLIEKDYRGTSLTLAYSGEDFFVPENVYLIGMMNTADRSLAMIDYALRRRFSFFEVEPAFLEEHFRRYQHNLASETLDELLEQVVRLNRKIAEDPSLGAGFRIGHSYFCGREEQGVSEDWLRAVVEFDLIPLLEEYWFDDPETLQQWKANLRGVFHDN